MKILADENCDRLFVAELRSIGFDVVWIRQFAPGVDDQEVFEIAVSSERLLVTNDRGFGMMAEQLGPRRPAGIVLMRLQRLPPATRTSMAVQAITTAGESLLGQFTVIEPHQMRSRPFKD